MTSDSDSNNLSLVSAVSQLSALDPRIITLFEEHQTYTLVQAQEAPPGTTSLADDSVIR